MNDKTLLVVEDDAMNMKLMRCLLSIHKYRVLEAQDGETGIEMARRFLPDLILMDIKLPGIDGLSATRMIREEPLLAKLPIIAVTSHAMRGDEERVRQAGCTEYLSKPIKTSVLLDAVERMLKSTPLKLVKSAASSNCRMEPSGR